MVAKSVRLGPWVVLLLAAIMFGLMAPPAEAAAPPWGACGFMTPEDKVVRTFPSPQGDLTLRCGGPRWSSQPGWGYRHIKWRHTRDFEGAAFGTYQNWRDIADLAMESLAADPDVVLPAGANQTCRSRLLFLKNIQTNQVVLRQTFVMYTNNETANITTVFPRDKQCAAMP